MIAAPGDAVGVFDASAPPRHPLHEGTRAWPETNCYSDLWIELLAARGCDPTAMLAFTVAVDFEGDQWTFLKPPAADLERLYGIAVRGLTVWRPLPVHLAEHTARGRVALVEVDAYFLPDTARTTYRAEHSRTTVGVDAIDAARRRLWYFHDAGYFELEGDDYDGALGLGAHARPDALPPYAELAMLDRVVRRDARALREIAGDLLAHHAAGAPHDNPVAQFAERLRADVQWLAASDLATFHSYAFATVRQCGSAWELAASFLAWLGGPAAAAAPRFESLAASAKAVQLCLARVSHTRRPVDLSSSLDAMAGEWDAAMALVRGAVRGADGR